MSADLAAARRAVDRQLGRRHRVHLSNASLYNTLHLLQREELPRSHVALPNY